MDSNNPFFAQWAKMWTPPQANGNASANTDWEKMMATWQETMKSGLDDLSTDENFLKFMGERMAQSMAFQKMMGDAVQQQLKAMHIASTEDIAAMRKRMRSLDDKLDDLGEQIEDFSAVLQATEGGQEQTKVVEAALEAAKAAIQAATQAEAAARAAEEATAAARAIIDSADAPKKTTRKRKTSTAADKK